MFIREAECTNGCNLTYLPPVFETGDGVGTIFSDRDRRKVAKASTGHVPLPFWISDVVKNWVQRYRQWE